MQDDPQEGTAQKIERAVRLAIEKLKAETKPHALPIEPPDPDVLLTPIGQKPKA